MVSIGGWGAVRAMTYGLGLGQTAYYRIRRQSKHIYMEGYRDGDHS